MSGELTSLTLKETHLVSTQNSVRNELTMASDAAVVARRERRVVVGGTTVGWVGGVHFPWRTDTACIPISSEILE